jgi:hypothetical protein
MGANCDPVLCVVLRHQVDVPTNRLHIKSVFLVQTPAIKAKFMLLRIVLGSDFPRSSPITFIIIFRVILLVRFLSNWFRACHHSALLYRYSLLNRRWCGLIRVRSEISRFYMLLEFLKMFFHEILIIVDRNCLFSW